MIENLPKGALPDNPDERDYRAELVMGQTPVIDWGTEFRQPEPPDTDQGQSDDCVGHAWSYYHWQLEKVRFAVRSVFAWIAQGYGAVIRDGGLRIVNSGQQTYDQVPDPSPETPQNMRSTAGLNASLASQNKELQSWILPSGMNYLAKAIVDYKGFVFGVTGTNEGWQDMQNPRPPLSGEAQWGHALYAFGYHTHSDGQKCIIAKSSWCNEVKEHHIRENYFNAGYTFNAWTLIPVQKGVNMKLVIVGKTIYLKGDRGALGFVDEDSEALLQSLDSAQPEPMSALDVPVVKIIEKGFTIHN